MQPGKYMKILGVPFGESFDMALFWEAKYDDVQRIIAAWRDHAKLSAVGRAMLANAMIASRFRYWVMCRHIPDSVSQAIVQDIEELVWSRNDEPHLNKLDAPVHKESFRRWMKKAAQYGDRKLDLGVGVIDWLSHVKGLQAKWILTR